VITCLLEGPRFVGVHHTREAKNFPALQGTCRKRGIKDRRERKRMKGMRGSTRAVAQHAQDSGFYP
jgi:hypothetical protein